MRRNAAISTGLPGPKTPIWPQKARKQTKQAEKQPKKVVTICNLSSVFWLQSSKRLTVNKLRRSAVDTYIIYSLGRVVWVCNSLIIKVSRQIDHNRTIFADFLNTKSLSKVWTAARSMLLLFSKPGA